MRAFSQRSIAACLCRRTSASPAGATAATYFLARCHATTTAGGSSSSSSNNNKDATASTDAAAKPTASPSPTDAQPNPTSRVEEGSTPTTAANADESLSSLRGDATSPSATVSAVAGEGAATAADGSSSTGVAGPAEAGTAVTTPDPEPVRWVQPAYQDADSLPIVDEKGNYIVSRVQWPTGEIAYQTPAPVDDKLAPRFGYNVVQVRKHVSWWKYNQKFPRLSLAYINIQVLFLLGLAWLVAFLTTEYRNATEAMRTPGAMVGEHRGKGPATNRTQKVTFEKDEMSALMDKAQNNWYDGKAEASYVGSKEYKMKKIPRPKEFSADDFRKR